MESLGGAVGTSEGAMSGRMNWAHRTKCDTMRRQGTVRFDDEHGERERRRWLVLVKVQCRLCGHRAEMALPKIGKRLRCIECGHVQRFMERRAHPH